MCCGCVVLTDVHVVAVVIVAVVGSVGHFMVDVVFVVDEMALVAVGVLGVVVQQVADVVTVELVDVVPVDLVGELLVAMVGLIVVVTGHGWCCRGGRCLCEASRWVDARWGWLVVA